RQRLRQPGAAGEPDDDVVPGRLVQPRHPEPFRAGAALQDAVDHRAARVHGLVAPPPGQRAERHAQRAPRRLRHTGHSGRTQAVRGTAPRRPAPASVATSPTTPYATSTSAATPAPAPEGDDAAHRVGDPRTTKSRIARPMPISPVHTCSAMVIAPTAKTTSAEPR